MNKFLCLFLFAVGGIISSSASSNRVDALTALCEIDGCDYPAVGFGSYPLTGSACTQALKQAMELRYRIIDTGTFYYNFEAIAEALKGGDRNQYFIISKVWHDRQSPADLHKDLELTLEQLQTENLDAYLLHWPNSEVPIEETLATMEEFRRDKKICHIGLCNITANHLKRALEVGVPISFVQVEMNPYFYDPELLQLCKDHSIIVQAWAPLGRGRIAEDTLLGQIGKKYGKTPSQVAIRWIVQHGCIPLPGSQNKKHIAENIEICDFTLSNEEMEEIDKRAQNGERERLTEAGLGFLDEFDFSYEECWPKERA